MNNSTNTNTQNMTDLVAALDSETETTIAIRANIVNGGRMEVRIYGYDSDDDLPWTVSVGGFAMHGERVQVDAWNLVPGRYTVIVWSNETIVGSFDITDVTVGLVEV